MSEPDDAAASADSDARPPGVVSRRAQSAGLLLFQRTDGTLRVLLGHMGGPYWVRRDEGAWTIPKGEYGADEDALAAARREFTEELGSPPPEHAEFHDLGAIRQRGGKVVHAWAVEADFDVTTLRSNTFELEWPPHSRRMQSFPELDRAEWFTLDAARLKIVAGQVPLLDRLAAQVGTAQLEQSQDDMES